MKRYILVLVPLAFFSGQLFGTAFVFAPTTNKVLLSADCGGLRVLTPLPPRSFYSFRLQLADDASPSEEDGDSSVKATVPQLTFNLVKAIVGAGVLSLPAGVAAYGNAPGAIIPAIALIIAIGMISAYDFGLIGRVCSLTNTTSFRQAWSKTVSEKTAWIPAFAVTFQTLGLVLAYSMILGETFSSLLAVIGVMVSPIASLLGITGFVLLPLCLLKNLSSLAPFSLLGSLGMIYTALAMAIRYFGKAYVGGGRFVSAFSTTAPSFGTVGARGALGPSVSILAAMLSTAYVVSMAMSGEDYRMGVTR